MCKTFLYCLFVVLVNKDHLKYYGCCSSLLYIIFKGKDRVVCEAGPSLFKSLCIILALNFFLSTFPGSQRGSSKAIKLSTSLL